MSSTWVTPIAANRAMTSAMSSADPRIGSPKPAAAVKEMAMGKGYQFDGRGPVELKGFLEPIPIFSVAWR